MQSLLSLQKHVIYGPVKSRRLGKSLGINLLPKNSKVCSFDCIYCHYGRTTIKLLDLRGADYPRPSTVALELEKALKTLEDIEYITFSGNGEPTLHPDFPEIVDRVISLRNELAPNALTAVLTNSSMLVDEAIRRATQRLDFCFAKLDAGDKVTFKKINRPHADIMFEDIVNVLRERGHPLKGKSREKTPLLNEKISFFAWLKPYPRQHGLVSTPSSHPLLLSYWFWSYC